MTGLNLHDPVRTSLSIDWNLQQLRTKQINHDVRLILAISFIYHMVYINNTFSYFI